MIEVPAAAIALPTFIGTVDFLSVGTNDLVQYLLAADRNNEALAELYSPLHPAVLRLLHTHHPHRAHARQAGGRVRRDGGRRRCSRRCYCSLGLTEFSLHPATLLEVRKAVRGSDLADLRKRSSALLRARDREASRVG